MDKSIGDTISDVDMDDYISDTDSTDTGARTISAPPEDVPGKWVYWSDQQRRGLEFLFADQNIIKSPWNDTEAKALRRDEQMLEYLVDFPCEEWLLGRDVAIAAYKALLRRSHLRSKADSMNPNRVTDHAWPRPLQSNPVSPLPVAQHLKSPPRNRSRGLFPPPLHTSSMSILNSTPQHSPSVAIVFGEEGNPIQDSQSSLPLPAPVDVPGARYCWSDGPPRIILELSARQKRPAIRRPSATNINGFSAGRKISRSSLPRTSLPRLSPPKAVSPDKGGEDRKFELPATTATTAAVTPPTPAATQIPPPDYEVHPKFPTSTLPKYPWLSEYAYELPEAWDDSIYPPGLIKAIEAQHLNNNFKVTAYAGGENNPSKKKRSSLANPTVELANSVTPEIRRPIVRATPEKKPQQKIRKGEMSKRLCFLSDQDEQHCRALGYNTVTEAVVAAMRNPFNDGLAQIMVYNDPGDSRIPGLRVPHFSVMDFARTRLQLLHFDHTYPDLAGKRIVDFCPELLWGETLLKVTSQTSLIPCDVQKRLGLNGTMMSDSTITKRIGSACDKGGFKKTNSANHKKYQEWFRNLRAIGYVDRPSTFDLGTAAEKYIASMPPVCAPSSPTGARSRGHSTVSAIDAPSGRTSVGVVTGLSGHDLGSTAGDASRRSSAAAPSVALRGPSAGASCWSSAATMSPAPVGADDGSVIRVAMGPPSPAYTAARKRARSESTLSAESGDERDPKRRA